MAASTDARTRLRRLGQLDLGEWVEIATGNGLWTVQHKIAQAISQPHAQVTVPSCNASGKTHLAARLALAFYDAYQPGTPCEQCGGPCRGAKVITTSSKWEHLRDNLWGEIRMAYPAIRDRVGFEGKLMAGDLHLKHTPDHFIIGQSAQRAEGFQGYHAAHKLIIGDEATSVDEEVSQGITSLMAAGDARLLLIFNPTTPDTWAATKTKSGKTVTIPITAFDTPHFTGEPVPEGANLINQRFLERLKEEGMGEGTYEWTTRVMAEFWQLSDTTLIPEEWVREARTANKMRGVRQVGIDLAVYGSDENVIAVRDGNVVTDLYVHPAMRTDLFFESIVTPIVKDVAPDYVVFDADGVGAGAIGDAMKLKKHMKPGGEVIGFRGNKKISDQFKNMRSTWWWMLRRKFENGSIALDVNDPTLMEQLSQMQYDVPNGAIRIETKAEMRKRGFSSPDRADAVMYAFAFSDDLPTAVETPDPQYVEEELGMISYNERDMWERHIHGDDGWSDREVDVVTGAPFDF